MFSLFSFLRLAFITMSGEDFRSVMDAILWAIKHLDRNISDTGLEIVCLCFHFCVDWYVDNYVEVLLLIVEVWMCWGVDVDDCVDVLMSGQEKKNEYLCFLEFVDFPAFLISPERYII